MARLTVFIMVAMMTAQLQAASESKGEDAAATSRAVTSGTMRLQAFTGFLSDCIAPLLSLEETAKLSVTNKESRSLLCGHVDLTDPAVQGILSANPIIGQHIKNYYLLGTQKENERRRGAIVESINRDYHTLGTAIRNRLIAEGEGTAYRAPKYVTATQEEFGDLATITAANTYFKGNPGVTLVLKAAAGNTTLTLDKGNIPIWLEKLSIVGDHVTQIGDFFLSDFTGLKELDLSLLREVKQIGDNLLAGCYRLTRLHLSTLSNLTTIGNYFLSGCRGLTTIDLSLLSKVIQIGDFFLSDCTKLKELDLSPLREVKQIGYSFLAGCKLLLKLDLNHLSKVTQIEEGFLGYCRGLDANTQAAVAQFKDAVAARAPAAAGHHPAGVAAGVAADL
jgi:hypothetical protein